MDFVTLSPKEFTKFEQSHPVGNFFQSSQRAELRTKMGFNTYLVGVKSSQKTIAAALIVERNQEAWIQLGPILDYENQELLDFFLTKIVEYARTKKFVKLEIFPPVVYATHQMDGAIIDKPDTDELFEAFKKHGFTHEGFTTEVENKANRWMFVKDLSGIF